MGILRLILAETRFRILNFVLSLFAITVAASLFIAGPTIISGYARDTRDKLAKLSADVKDLEDQTRTMKLSITKELGELDKKTKRIMRDLGINLRIVHRNTRMDSLYTNFVAEDFPEDYVNRLATAPQIETIVHLIATLQHKITWNQRTTLLTGIQPVLTRSQKNEEKKHMVDGVESGSVFLGHELGIGRNVGETIEIAGHTFKIARIVEPSGGLEDVQLVVDLRDAQKVLDKPGKINQIMALNCKCKGDRISIIRKELEGVLPDTKVTELSSRATAREQQRDAVEKTRNQQLARVNAHYDQAKQLYADQTERRRSQEETLKSLVGGVIPLVILTAATFVGIMSWLNVRERRTEIGVLRALGKSGLNVAALFLGKSALMGILGGIAGCVTGYELAAAVGRQMSIAGQLFEPNLPLLAITIVGAPLIASMAAYLPMLSALKQDPAIALMEH
ncbi:MAG: FtsX-like permease family protein [Planctomycetota bacterium]|nr:FtsX-like permease family protein [Planctomycetota bacterium]